MVSLHFIEFIHSLFHPPTVPPDILDFPTSTDMVVREGSNVSLVCAARGSPTPIITWRRENNSPFTVGAGPEGKQQRHCTRTQGSVLAACPDTGQRSYFGILGS